MYFVLEAKASPLIRAAGVHRRVHGFAAAIGGSGSVEFTFDKCAFAQVICIRIPIPKKLLSSLLERVQ